MIGLLPGYCTPSTVHNTVERVSPDDHHHFPTDDGFTQPSSRAWMLPPRERVSITPAWRNRAGWLRALAVALAMPNGVTVVRHEQTSRRAVLAVARIDAQTAEHRTGRNVATSHHTVSTRTGLSIGTVQKCRRVLERMQFMRTVAVGRYLTNAERAEASTWHGGRQIRAASTRILSLPKYAGGYGSGHLSRRDKDLSPLTSRNYYPTRASARGAAARQQKQAKKFRQPVTLNDQIFAAKLRDRIGWLKGDFHTLAIARVLNAENVDAAHWTVNEFCRALDTAATENGRRTEWTGIQHPLAYLRHFVRKLEAPPRAEPTIKHQAVTERSRTREALRRNPHATPPTAEYRAMRAKLEAQRSAARQHVPSTRKRVDNS